MNDEDLNGLMEGFELDREFIRTIIEKPVLTPRIDERDEATARMDRDRGLV